MLSNFCILHIYFKRVTENFYVLLLSSITQLTSDVRNSRFLFNSTSRQGRMMVRETSFLHALITQRILFFSFKNQRRRRHDFI